MTFLLRAFAAALLFASPVTAQAPAQPTGVNPEEVRFVAADSNLILLFANPVAGQEEAFNRWSDHAFPDLARRPGIVRAQRFGMLARKGRPDPVFKYLFLLEVHGERPLAAEIQAAIEDGHLRAADGKPIATVEGATYTAEGGGYPGPLIGTAPADMPGLTPEDSKLLVVFASPAKGREAAFDSWYDQHIREFMAFPNYVRVQKFRMLPGRAQPEAAPRYLFLHEFKGDQDRSFAQTLKAVADGRTHMPDPAIVAAVIGTNYAPLGPGFRGSPAE